MAELILADRDTEEPEEVPCDGGETFAYTQRAPEKESGNEDAAGVWAPLPGVVVLAVADGLGGAASGATASAIAMGRLAAHLGRCSDKAALRASIMDGFEDANQEILALGVGAGTTLVVVQIVDGELRAYHVGDSVALVVGQRGKMKLETIAHSPVGYGVAAGLIDPDAALHHDDRHYVSNHLGATDMHIQVGSPLRVASRDTLLLATDGLVDNVRIGEIVELIRKGPLRAAAQALATLCARRMRAPLEDEAGDAPRKPDDATFILHRATAASAKRRSRKPHEAAV